MKYLIYRCPAKQCKNVHCIPDDENDSRYIFSVLQVLILELPFVEIETDSQTEVLSAIEKFKALERKEKSTNNDNFWLVD